MIEKESELYLKHQKLDDIKHFIQIEHPEKKLQLEREKLSQFGCIRNYSIIGEIP